MDADQHTDRNALGGGRRVEILLDDDLYERVRIKAMRERVSLRSVGAQLFAHWVESAAEDAPD